MDENDVIDPAYLKGFNEGYLIKKHLPELADKLAQALNGSPRDTGFKDGRQQLILEKDRELYPKWLKTDRSINRDQSKDKTLDKDLDNVDDLE